MSFPLPSQEKWGGKRHHSFNHLLKNNFNARVYKISLRADFTCPNRNSRVTVGGCIYCNNSGHTPPGYRPAITTTEQLTQGAAALRRRHRTEKFIAYFQCYTNTYRPIAKLERFYRDALDFPDVVGLPVATRPDCLEDEVLDLLADIARHTYVWLKIGLESMHKKTLVWANRSHGLQEFVDAVHRSKARGLRLCAHLILGFPTESREETLQTPFLLNRLEINGVKLHNLHVIKITALEKIYRRGHFALPSRAETVALIVDFLELLARDVAIQRLSGGTYRALAVTPAWSADKIGMHIAIQRELADRDTWQGRNYRGGSTTDSLQMLSFGPLKEMVL